MKHLFSVLLLALAVSMPSQAAVTDVIEINDLEVSKDNLIDYTQILGLFQVVGVSADYQVLYTVDAPQVVGTYGWEDMDPDYPVSLYIAAEDQVHNAIDADLTVNRSSNGYTFDGHMTIADGRMFHITMNYVMEEAQEYYYDVTSFSIDDLWAVMGAQMIYMTNEDNSAELMLMISDSEIVSGYTYGYNQFDLTMSMLMVDNNFIAIAGGDFTYTQMAGGEMATANITDAEGNIYHFNYENMPTGIDELKVGADKPVKRLVNGQVVIENNGILYNIMGQPVK